MTAVVIAPRIENPTNDTEAVASSGYFNIRPSAAYVSGGQWVQPVWPANVTNLTGVAVTVQLDPQPNVPYELFVSIPNGRGKRYEFTEFRIVAGAGPVAWETLQQVSGPGGAAVLTDVVNARLAALEAAVGSVSGGASNVASITDMSPLARLFNKDTTQSAMQSRLNVPPVGAAPTAHTHVATTDLTATGTKDATTFLRGDNQWAPPTGAVAGSVAWTAITGKPATFPPVVPIAQSDVTGLAALAATVATHTAQLATLTTQTAQGTQELVWDGTTTTNATSYGVYDTTKLVHNFRGARDPVIAGYTLSANDHWYETIPPDTTLTSVTIDDSLLTYTGAWSAIANALNYNSGDHYTVATGAKASFTWTGVAGGKATVVVKQAAHHGIMNVVIDGVAVGVVDEYAAADAYQVNAFTSAALGAGAHTIELTNSGTKNAASSGFTVEVDALIITGAVAGTGGTTTGGTPPTTAQPTGFLSRVGMRIQLNGANYRASGVNLPWSMGCGSEVNLTPTVAQHASMFAAAKPNSLYRIWMFGGAPDLNRFDQIIAAARPYGHRFIPVLSDQQGGCGDPWCGPNPSAFYGGGWISGGWRDNWLTPIINRYKTEPLIGFYEWVNEPQQDQSVRTFFDAVGAYVRNTLGDQHLYSTGTMSQYGNPTGHRLLAASPYMDIMSQHEYDQTEGPSHWTAADDGDAVAVGKPWFVGESGIDAAVLAAGTARAAQIQRKIAGLHNSWPNCFGFCYWSGAAINRGMEVAINGSPEINVINTEPM